MFGGFTRCWILCPTLLLGGDGFLSFHLVVGGGVAPLTEVHVCEGVGDICKDREHHGKYRYMYIYEIRWVLFIQVHMREEPTPDVKHMWGLYMYRSSGLEAPWLHSLLANNHKNSTICQLWQADWAPCGDTGCCWYWRVLNSGRHYNNYTQYNAFEVWRVQVTCDCIQTVDRRCGRQVRWCKSNLPWSGAVRMGK